MISGSSEQLLEQHQNEQRRLKLKKLEPKKKNAAKQRPRTRREQVRFYVTSALAFLSVAPGASLLFLVPLYVDPAISTLASDFADPPTWCTTVRREDVVGINNCTWSSCREGCTSDMYKCLHVYVTYAMRDDAANASDIGDGDGGVWPSANLTAAELANATADLQQSEEAMLLVNIKGCGYPPSVTCKNFSELYGVEGAVYPCYYSRVNRTVVMTQYNRSNQISVIVHFFAVPFVITVVSSVALCVMHCDCRFQRERRPRRGGGGGGRGECDHRCGGHHSDDDDDGGGGGGGGRGGDGDGDDGGDEFDGRSCGQRSAGGRGGGGGYRGGGMPGTRRGPYVENLSDSSISTRVDMLTPAIEVYRPPPL